MNNDRKNNMGHEALVLIGCIMLLAFICRLWPILMLMLLAVFAAAIVLLLRPQADTNDTKPESPQPKSNVKSPNEDDVVTLAYSVILRRITELVTNEYPNARWIWESPNARQQIFISSELYILLNCAGGYKRAKVQLHNLRVISIEYEGIGHDESCISDNKDAENIPVQEESERQNYELIAFEWVDTHIISINEKCNEAIGQGFTEILISEDDLPTPESWSDICTELKRVGVSQSTISDDGIKINLTQLNAERN